MAGARPSGLPVAFGADVVRDELRRRLTARGAAKRIAFEAGVTPSLISRTAKGTIPPGERIATALGFRRVMLFERDE